MNGNDPLVPKPAWLGPNWGRYGLWNSGEARLPA